MATREAGVRHVALRADATHGREVNAALLRDQLYSDVSHHLAVEESIVQLSGTFEEVEHLALTMMPLPYAQLSRLATLLFLLIIPLTAVSH